MDDAEFDALMARHIERKKAQMEREYGWCGPAPSPAAGRTDQMAQFGQSLGSIAMIPTRINGGLDVIYAHTPFGAWLCYDARHGWRALPPGVAPPVDEQLRPFTRPDSNVPAAPTRSEYEAAGGGQPYNGSLQQGLAASCAQAGQQSSQRQPGVGSGTWFA